MRYEYKVVPAPERGEKLRGVKDAEARFAASVEKIMNDMAQRGWEYQRSETLPSEERAGLTQTQTVWRNLLVFRRPSAGDASVFEPKMLEPPQPPAPKREDWDTGGPENLFHPIEETADLEPENGVENLRSVNGLPGALMARAARLRSGD